MKDFYSTSEARKHLSELVSQVAYQGKSFTIGRHGKAEAILVANMSHPPSAPGPTPNVMPMPDFLSASSTTFFHRLANEFGLNLIILFGSRASKKARPDSDLDIAYYAKEPISAGQERKILARISEHFPINDIDLINLATHSNVVLRYEIFTQGKILLGSPELFAAYRRKAFFEYHDYEPYLDRRWNLTKRKLNRLLSLKI